MRLLLEGIQRPVHIAPESGGDHPKRNGHADYYGKHEHEMASPDLPEWTAMRKILVVAEQLAHRKGDEYGVLRGRPLSALLAAWRLLARQGKLSVLMDDARLLGWMERCGRVGPAAWPKLVHGSWHPAQFMLVEPRARQFKLFLLWRLATNHRRLPEPRSPSRELLGKARAQPVEAFVSVLMKRQPQPLPESTNAVVHWRKSPPTSSDDGHKEERLEQLLR
jgi:hypothetical protein